MDNTRGFSPMLRKDVLKRVIQSDKVMSINSTINKLIVLLMIFLTMAGIAWYFSPMFNLTGFWIFVAIAVIIAVLTFYKPRISPYTTPIYIVLKGLAIGFLIRPLNMYSKGLLLQIVLPIVFVLFTMLIIYKFHIVKGDNELVKLCTLCGGSLILLYLTDLFLKSFGLELSFLHIDKLGGFLISLIIITLASSFFIFDFYFIEKAAHLQIPKYMEWYLSFGVFVTIVWLYIGIIISVFKIKRKKKK